MIVVTVWVPNGCNFQEDEFDLVLDAAIHDTLNLENEPSMIRECIVEYVRENDFKIKEEIAYTFFLHRANIAADPIPEPGFDVWKVIANLAECRSEL